MRQTSIFDALPKYKIDKPIRLIELFAGGGKQDSKIAVTADNGILVNGKKCRIRILTPRERFRLMGVRDEDFDKIAAHQSESSLNHLSGDSIVVDVLMAIFGEMIKNKE